MLYAFDLDGTLIDSREAVLESYRAVGVEPPPDFFMRSWHEWLSDSTLHDAKNRVYIQKLSLIKPLPLIRLYFDLGQPSILTGASSVAVDMIAKAFGLKRRMIYPELTLVDKIKMMNNIKEGGIMFEDQLEAAQRMRSETKWVICHTI